MTLSLFINGAFDLKKKPNNHNLQTIWQNIKNNFFTKQVPGCFRNLAFFFFWSFEIRINLILQFHSSSFSLKFVHIVTFKQGQEFSINRLEHILMPKY